jgi:D-alanyl-D-alanine carboxypeptidase
MTNRNSPQNPRRAKRNRYQNITLLAIAATFVSLLLVFAILLGINAVMAIRGNNEPDQGLENGDNTQPPEGNEGNEPNLPGDGGDGPGQDQPPQMVAVPSDAIHTGNLILVNLDHVFIFPEKQSLVNVFTMQEVAQTRGKYFQLKDAALFLDPTAYLQMDKFLQTMGDSSVLLASAHRTAEQQSASGSSIPAGYSDSHTGLSFSLRGQTSSGAPLPLTDKKYTWLYENCYKYGFVVRYPADKVGQTGVDDYTNYFRYVGYVHAYLMTTKNLCLEEYIPFLQSHTYGEKALKVTTDDGSNYEIYYVPATGTQTQVPVPENGNYTISGDNEGGFIVTVKVS